MDGRWVRLRNFIQSCFAAWLAVTLAAAASGAANSGAAAAPASAAGATAAAAASGATNAPATPDVTVPPASNSPPALDAPDGDAPASEKTAVASSIVQQGLLIHELDKELVRLKAEEAEGIERIGAQQAEIAKQEVVLDERTKAAGNVLRSYYMGERDQLWLLLFRMRSLGEVLLTLDYLQAIVTNDFRTLEAFRETYRERQRLLAELEARQAELADVIASREYQRERLAAERSELERRLARLTEAERLAELERIRVATASWEEVGIPIFEQVLGGLSEAMLELPELLSDPALLEIDGPNIEVRISEALFNDFLRQKHPMFERFAFAFGPDGLAVDGRVDDMTAFFAGRFQLETEPANLLRFQIDSISFNGLELPDTTRSALQERYNLTFQPSLLYAGLSIEELINEEDQLRVRLTFDGLPLAFD